VLVIDDPRYQHKIEKSTASVTNAALANTWFAECVANHKACNESAESHWVPTRLLEIDNSNSSPTIRLVELAENPNLVPEYMALSHCWGNSQIITLTAKTIDRLKEVIPQSELPLTFQNAITAATWLGKRYLWVDSLCILQDSLEDWWKEARMMRSVYKSAWGTIAATGASDSSIGCFFERDPEVLRPFKISVSWNDYGPRVYYCFPSEIWIDGVGKAPLNKRAWVQQERLLSRRVLHFGSQQLFWECHEKEACESFPEGLPTKYMEQDMWTSYKNLHEFKNVDGRLYPQWERVARAYSRGALTKEEDKVIALAGIAQEIEVLYGDQYLAGMWRRYLGEFLVWQIEDGRQDNGRPSRRPSVYRAPSWSWLSVDGVVDPGTAFGERVLIEILDAQVETWENTGQIKHGYIRLRGTLVKAEWIREPYLSMGTHDLDDVLGNPRFQLILDGKALSQVYARLDDNTKVVPNTVFCLPILPQRYRRRAGQPTLEGLILIPSESTEFEFRRVGYFRAEGKLSCQKILGREQVFPTGTDIGTVGATVLTLI
jgi:hypothetical protein